MFYSNNIFLAQLKITHPDAHHTHRNLHSYQIRCVTLLIFKKKASSDILEQVEEKKETTTLKMAHS